MNYCSSCGRKINSDARFCVNCGQKLGSHNEKIPNDLHLHDIPVNRKVINHINSFVKKNPIVSILVSVVCTLLLVVFLRESPEERAEKIQKSNEEYAIEAAENSVSNQIETDGFTFIKVEEITASINREENTNTQMSSPFNVLP